MDKNLVSLITGATGNVGGRVAERLIQSGHRPRLLVRSLDKARARFGDRAELVAGDLADRTSLDRALAGVEALFLVNTGADLAAKDALAAEAARRAGVQQIVKLSSFDARREEQDERSPSDGSVGARTGDWHARGQAAIEASGVRFTFLQPGGFMSNALSWAAAIRAENVVRAPTGAGRIAFVHPDDIAAVATRALETSGYAGESLALTGPRALSYAEMAAQIGAAIERPVRFEAISDDAARAQLLARGMAAAQAEALVRLWRSVREGRVAQVTETIERVLGREPIGFERWAQENAHAFR